MNWKIVGAIIFILLMLMVEWKLWRLRRAQESIKKEIAEMKKQIEGMNKQIKANDEYVYRYSGILFPLIETIKYQTLFRLILKKLNVTISKKTKEESFELVDNPEPTKLKYDGKPFFNLIKKRKK